MHRFLALIACSLVLVAAACGADDGGTVKEEGSSDPSGSGSASSPASGSEAACVPFGDTADADTTVDVSLDEWSIDAPDTVTAGTVRLATSNMGDEPHELVVVRAESVADLPRDAEGEVDEFAVPEEDFLGEIEPFPAGETCDGVFELEPANYVLFCAIVEDEGGEVESHFALGMNRLLVVE